MAKQRNAFLKGITSDLHESHVENSTWVFPSKNIRIYNKRGQGFVISAMPGNRKKFEVSDGYVIVAAKEHRGIVYLVTVKEVSGTWVTQIGCYPYPEGWGQSSIDHSVEGFVDRYEVLRNYDESPLKYMETTLFNYNQQSEVKLIIDDAFDESANLYLCDGKNPDKVVNVGFLYTGKINSTLYKKEDFEGKLNHILYSLNPARVKDIKMSQGGELRPGNYNLFFAYKTETYNKTEYNSQSFPISVFYGNSITSINGSVKEGALIDKKITVSLTNIDTSYKYLVVGVLRFYGDGTQNYAEYDEYEIDKDYIISGPEMEIVITGREDEIILTTEGLFAEFLMERVSKDHCFLNSRIWKANLSTNIYDKKLFVDLAQLVTASSFEKVLDADPCYNEVISSSGKPMKTQDDNYIYHTLGYFDGEIYPFSVSFQLKSGVITDAYPIEGLDEKSISTDPLDPPAYTTKKGLFRSWGKVEKYGTVGIKFRIKEILNEIKNNPKYSEIKGFYIMRSERIVNFLYDGVLERTANGIRISKNLRTNQGWREGKFDGKHCAYSGRESLWFAASDENGAYHMPVFKYNHELDGVTYPLRDNNYSSFPHATYYNNNKDEDKSSFESTLFLGFLNDILLIDGDTVTDYSIAVEYPFEVEDEEKVAQSRCDKDLITSNEDSVDKKLNISKDHFALFSPDFMTEAHHLTEDGQEYTIIIYDRIEAQCYKEGTKEYKPLASRTRIYDFSKESTTPTTKTFKTTLRKVLEIHFGTATSKAIPGSLWIKDCEANEYIPFQWIYNGKYFKRNWVDNTTVDLGWDPELINSIIVFHNGSVWMCIQNTLKGLIKDPPDDVEPKSGSLYWKEVDGSPKYNVITQETGPYPFNGAVLDTPSGLYVKASCTDGIYNKPASPTSPSAFSPITMKLPVYNIEKGTYQGKGFFTSYAEDGKEFKLNGKKGLYSLTGEYIGIRNMISMFYGQFKTQMVQYNRSYQTPAYMGLIISGFTYDPRYVYMCKIFKRDPYTDDSYFKNEDDLFSPENTQYWVVSDLIDIEDASDSKEIFKGDNFKSASWFRMSHAVDYDDNRLASRASGEFKSWFANVVAFKPRGRLKGSYLLDKAYGHGILYGMFTQNRRNVLLRSVLDVEDDEGEAISYTFFPRVSGSGSVLGWIYSSDAKNNNAESVNINDGYNHVSGFIKKLGVDINLPVDSSNKRTRIAFSERRMVDSFKDGYRMMSINNKEDFSTNHGEIMRIEELYGNLITIRRRIATKHLIGQKEITEDLQYSDSTIYLSNEEYPILYYGIDDWHAFVKTGSGIYCVDARNSLIFNISVEKGGKNTPGMSSSLMSRMLSVEKMTHDFIMRLNDNRTTPIDRNGIALGYNEDFSEVYFTFIHGEDQNTLVFQESFGYFSGTSDISAALYTPFGKGLLTSVGALNNKGSIMYINDHEEETTIFYEIEKENVLSFIVNGKSSSSKSDDLAELLQSAKKSSSQDLSTMVTKIFESLDILTPHILFDKIDYETESQKGTYIFTENSSEFWKDSEWKEGAWFVPIIKEVESDEDIYYTTDSVFRGKWLKVTLYLRAGNEFYISDIITTFKQSFS